MAITTHVESLTPEAAQKILDEHHGHNRALAPGRVRRYMNLMARSEWKLNGEALVFDNTGQLVDGQHRLAALAALPPESTVKSVAFVVVRGVTPDVVMTLDTGANRSFADVLHLNDISDSKVLAGTLYWAHSFQVGTPFSVSHGNAPSYAQMEALRTNYPEITQSVKFALALRKHCATIHCPPRLIAALHFVFSRRDREMADQFMAQLCTGENLAQTSPIYTCRDRLARSKDVQLRKLTARDKGILITRAWNQLRTEGPFSGRRPRAQQIAPGAFPEPI